MRELWECEECRIVVYADKPFCPRCDGWLKPYKPKLDKNCPSMEGIRYSLMSLLMALDIASNWGPLDKGTAQKWREKALEIKEEFDRFILEGE